MSYAHPLTARYSSPLHIAYYRFEQMCTFIISKLIHFIYLFWLTIAIIAIIVIITIIKEHEHFRKKDPLGAALVWKGNRISGANREYFVRWYLFICPRQGNARTENPKVQIYM